MSDENETSDETPEAKPQEPGTEATDEGAPAPGEELLDGTSKTYDELVLENEDLRARLLRAVADAENVRKRAERDQQDTAKYAISKFIFCEDMEVKFLKSQKRIATGLSSALPSGAISIWSLLISALDQIKRCKVTSPLGYA
ncbi:MAG: nucleotide exchange factor GrpE [Pseudomonadota bacterium]